MARKIIHVDMDAFFAAVEQRDDPALRGRPIAVGSPGARGVVMTASYEARPFGVRSAMPSVTAKRLCPDLLFVPPRFDAYKAVSRQVREVFLSYTDLVEPLSLDEAYLDVTAPKQGGPFATAIARAIKRDIRDATSGLTASAGVSINKLLAKLASDLDKPDGLSVIRPEEAEAFVARLPIDRFHGIGPVTARKMRALGIATGADLRARSEEELTRRFGSHGRHYFRVARAIDERPVQPHRPLKSIGAERTFAHDLTDPDAMLCALDPIAETVAARVTANGASGRTVTLKIKTSDFAISTRSRTLAGPIRTKTELLALAAELLRAPAPPGRPVRLLGLTVSGFAPDGGDADAAGGQLALRL